MEQRVKLTCNPRPQPRNPGLLRFLAKRFGLKAQGIVPESHAWPPKPEPVRMPRGVSGLSFRGQSGRNAGVGVTVWPVEG